MVGEWQEWLMKIMAGEKKQWAEALHSSLSVYCSVLFYAVFLDVNSTSKQMTPQLASLIVFGWFLCFKLVPVF